MIEKYNSTVKDIATGQSHAVSSGQLVCDRCGFAKKKADLRKVDDLDLCESCIDKSKDRR